MAACETCLRTDYSLSLRQSVSKGSTSPLLSERMPAVATCGTSSDQSLCIMTHDYLSLPMMVIMGPNDRSAIA